MCGSCSLLLSALKKMNLIHLLVLILTSIAVVVSPTDDLSSANTLPGRRKHYLPGLRTFKVNQGPSLSSLRDSRPLDQGLYIEVDGLDTALVIVGVSSDTSHTRKKNRPSN